jgi:hypothetical protein
MVLAVRVDEAPPLDTQAEGLDEEGTRGTQNDVGAAQFAAAMR